MEITSYSDSPKRKIEKFPRFGCLRLLGVGDILVQMSHSGLVVQTEPEEGVPAPVEWRHHRVRDVGVLEAKRMADLVESCL